MRNGWRRHSVRLEPPFVGFGGGFFDNYFNFYNDEGND